MKTPREILLARHRAAEPQLDVIRRRTLAAAAPTAAAEPRWTSILVSLCLAPWRELILPSRRIWTGLATVWVALFLINAFQRDAADSAQARRGASPSAMASWQVEQRWMNELLADRAMPPDADRPRNAVPRPRTEFTGIAAA
jgi:hypothetical protein